MTTIRKRNSSQIPFGWEEHPQNSSLLVENDDEQDALTYVREFSDDLSVRKSIGIILARTGRKLSPRGMQILLERDY